MDGLSKDMDRAPRWRWAEQGQGGGASVIGELMVGNRQVGGPFIELIGAFSRHCLTVSRENGHECAGQ